MNIVIPPPNAAINATLKSAQKDDAQVHHEPVHLQSCVAAVIYLSEATL